VNKTLTTGPRRLVDSHWYDDNGRLPPGPDLWSPPMTDDEIAMAAAADPDARPIDKPLSDKARRRGLEGSLRFKLELTHASFEARYGVPADVLLAWERGTATPSPTELAYLKLIAADPEGVAAMVAKRVELVAAE
jgi:putative transcriptional regulator